MPSPGKTTVTSAITNDLHDQILAACSATGLSKNVFIHKVLASHFGKADTKPQPDNAALDRVIDYVVNNTLISKSTLKKIANA